MFLDRPEPERFVEVRVFGAEDQGVVTTLAVREDLFHNPAIESLSPVIRVRGHRVDRTDADGVSEQDQIEFNHSDVRDDPPVLFVNEGSRHRLPGGADPGDRLRDSPDARPHDVQQIEDPGEEFGVFRE